MPLVGGPKVRPGWCPFSDCDCAHSSADAICGGKLSVSEQHAGGENNMRLCIKQCDASEVTSFMVNDEDLDWVRRVFDGMQGKGDFAFQMRGGEKA